MSLYAKLPLPEPTGAPRSADSALPLYLNTLSLVERLHRLLLDIIKDEFERLSILDVNAVQALILFHMADNEVTAGELRSRGFYQGSNVSYNLKKLVELGYMHHERCAIDRRSVRVRLTEKGQDLRHVLTALFARHTAGLDKAGLYDEDDGLGVANAALAQVERFWAEQIRYIY